MSDATTNEALHAMSERIDKQNLERDPEAMTWGRLAKIQEESGEVIGAYIGVTGQNFRKGVTHTIGDVYDELLDVAATAVLACAHLVNHDREVAPLDDLAEHIHWLLDRAVEGSDDASSSD